MKRDGKMTAMTQTASLLNVDSGSAKLLPVAWQPGHDNRQQSHDVIDP